MKAATRRRYEGASTWRPTAWLTTFAEVPWNAPYYLRCGFEIVSESLLTPGLREIRRAEAAAALACVEEMSRAEGTDLDSKVSIQEQGQWTLTVSGPEMTPDADWRARHIALNEIARRYGAQGGGWSTGRG
jgi:hypothetical protein